MVAGVVIQHPAVFGVPRVTQIHPGTPAGGGIGDTFADNRPDGGVLVPAVQQAGRSPAAASAGAGAGGGAAGGISAAIR